MIDLWAHQQDAVDKLGPLGAGYLALDMGCGKSRTALALGVDVWKCRRILVLCPKSVVAVWPKEFAKCGLEDWMILPLDAGTVAERAERAEAGFLCAEIDGVGLCVVLNYESTIREPMASTLAKLPWDLAIYDECLPGGTPVSTPGGDRAIERLEVGDEVLGVDGDGRVVVTQIRAVFRRPLNSGLCAVNGVTMTPNHPVWTRDRGYVPAGVVADSDMVSVLEVRDGDAHACLRVVRADVRSQSAAAEWEAATLLWDELLGEVADVAAGVQAEVHTRAARCRIREDETATAGPGVSEGLAGVPGIGEEPVQGSGEEGGTQREGAGEVESRRLSPPERRERPAHGPADDAGPGPGVEDGARSVVWEPAARGDAQLLQDRRGEPGLDDRGRGGRPQPSGQSEDGRGREEGRVSAGPGMDDCAGAEQGCPRGPQRSGGASAGHREVFNIETGTGNYFAGGLLVHNCHRIKGADGKQSQVARAIARGVPHRLCLSGTPMPHSLLDLFPQFEVVDSSILGTDWWAFRRHHVVSKEDAAREKARGYGKKRLDELNALRLPLDPEQRKAAVMRFGEDALACKERVGTVKPTPAALEALGNRRIDDLVRENPWWRTAVERYQNEDELQAKIEPHMCRVMTRDVMDLPPVTHLERLCLLGAKARRAHEQAEQELRVEIGDGKGVDTACVFSKLTRCAQISNGFLPVTDDDGNREIVEVGREKAELLAEVLADLPADEPVAIFSWFIEDLRIIGEVCEKAGRPYLQHGGDRSEMGRWQAGEGNVLGVQIQKGGVGVDLTRARYQVYYSVTFNLGDYEQSLKRLDRPGLRDHLFVVHLLAAGTVDERVYAALANRQEIVGAVMDGIVREGRKPKGKRRAA